MALTISPERFADIRLKLNENRLARQAQSTLLHEGASVEQRFANVEALLARLDQLSDEAE